MGVIKLLAGSLLLAALAPVAAAQDTDAFSKAKAAVNALFPDERFDVWTYTRGDLNGDGIEDLSLVLTNTEAAGPRRERLAVLSGMPDGSYSILAVSDEFCDVRYHYNLEVKGNSLFVTGFENLTPSSSYTFQFRHNAKRKELELIGEETLEEDDEENSSYKVSVNYLNKRVIYSRKQNKRHKEVEVQMKGHSLVGLQGFNCSTYDNDIKELNFYIDEDFSFKQ